MWTRRTLLASAGVSLCSLTVAGQLQRGRTTGGTRYLADLRIDERPRDVDDDDESERLVRVRFVPRRPLVAVRLEHRVDDATNPDLARELDDDGDGWYVVARRIRLGYDHDQRGNEQFLSARRSRDALDGTQWLAESRGFQPGRTARPDVRGFARGDVLRVVAVPAGRDPVVVTEHVVGVETAEQ
ncbi:hypothetical protein [Salinigranum halophilum]|uniref:hypothetical protein n=1 Tax=Salinigranum halophilum TaxID=2565931 RepID=UPI0010A8F999|nr:hypothetical protein [Salinigranum halophilum]